MPEPPVFEAQASEALPRVAIRLLKGVIYRRDDEELWQSLVDIQASVRGYVEILNLRLELNEGEGYAYLRSRDETGEEQEDKLPQLILRHPLSYQVSLVLALLRKRLVEFDAAGGDTRLVLTRDEILDMVRVFLPDSSDEVRLKKRLNEHLSRIVKLGFLRRMASAASNAQSTF